MRNLLLAVFLTPVLASAQNTGIWNQDYNQRLPASMDGTDLVIIQKAPYTPGLTAGKPTNQQYLIINKAATLGATGTGASALTVTGSQTVGDLLEWTAAGNANSSGMSLADVLSIANHTGILDPDQGGLGVDASMEPDGIWVNDTGSPSVIGLANGLVGVVDSLPVPVATMGGVFDAVGVTGTQDNTTVLFGDGVLRTVPTGGLGANLSSSADEIQSDSGTLEFSGTGGTNNEGFNLDFETTANTVDVLPINGANVMDFTDWTLNIGALDVTSLTAGSLLFEGATADDFETAVAVVDPTADRTFTLPDASGTAAFAAGYRTIWVDAGAMVSRTTAGATADTEEYGTNDIMSDQFLFDGTDAEYAQWRIAMPDEWDRGTVKVKIYWGAAAGASAADTVEWEVKAGAISNDDAIDAALGSAVTVGDTVIAVGDLHVTAASAALTVGGTPALGDVTFWEIRRDPGGTDDMTEDAKLLGVMIQYAVSNATNTVW